jgi:hypothetical protein
MGIEADEISKCQLCNLSIHRNRLKQWAGSGGSIFCYGKSLQEHIPGEIRIEPAGGTFACPICGLDTPHEHTSLEIAEHRCKTSC